MANKKRASGQSIRIPPGFYLLRVRVNERGLVAAILALRWYDKTTTIAELKDASPTARRAFRKLLRVRPIRVTVSHSKRRRAK